MPTDEAILAWLDRLFPYVSSIDAFASLHFPALADQVAQEQARSAKLLLLLRGADRALLVALLSVNASPSPAQPVVTDDDPTLSWQSRFGALRAFLTGTDAVERAFSALESGWLIVDVPSKLTLGRPEILSVSASRSELDQLLHSLPRSGLQQLRESLLLGRRLRVELVVDHPEELEVVALSLTEQPVLRSELTVWEWRVCGLAVGPQRALRIQLTNLAEAGDGWCGKSTPARTLHLDIEAESVPAQTSPPPSISRAQLRRLLTEVVRSDSELNALCIDYFSDTYRLFSSGMNRTDKLNELLSAVPPERILAALAAQYPALQPAP